MHLGRTRSVGLVGIRGMLVDVEVDITPGLPKIVFSGTVDPAVREALVPNLLLLPLVETAILRGLGLHDPYAP